MRPPARRHGALGSARLGFFMAGEGLGGGSEERLDAAESPPHFDERLAKRRTLL